MSRRMIYDRVHTSEAWYHVFTSLNVRTPVDCYVKALTARQAARYVARETGNQLQYLRIVSEMGYDVHF